MAKQEVKLINEKKYACLTYYDKEFKTKKEFYYGSEEKNQLKIIVIKKVIKLINKQIKTCANKKQHLMNPIVH